MCRCSLHVAASTHRRFFHSSSLKCGAALTRQAVVSECCVVLTAVTCARHRLPRPSRKMTLPMDLRSHAKSDRSHASVCLLTGYTASALVPYGQQLRRKGVLEDALDGDEGAGHGDRPVMYCLSLAAHKREGRPGGALEGDEGARHSGFLGSALLLMDQPLQLL